MGGFEGQEEVNGYTFAAFWLVGIAILVYLGKIIVVLGEIRDEIERLNRKTKSS